MVQQTVAPPVVRGQRYPMSWEEFLAWSPSEGKSEWVEGWGVAYVSNSALHSRLVGFFGELLRVFVRVFDLGEVFQESMLMRLETRPSGRCPDIFVIRREDGSRVLLQWFEGPALFVVEFISEESVERDLVEKRAEYERAGVPEYLAIDTRPGKDRVIFLRLDDHGRYQAVQSDAAGCFHSEVLFGFWFDPAWFRQDPSPDVEDLMLLIAPAAYEAWLMAKLRARREHVREG